MLNWFFDGWLHPARTAIMAVTMYVTMLVVIRIGGKRSLTKMNVFDFVFSVAIGSMVAGVVTSPDVSYVDGLVGIGAFTGLQILFGRLSRRPRWQRWINGSPTLLLRDGEFDRQAMRDQKIAREEILSALRLRGIRECDRVAAVVLETDGEFSVLPEPPAREIETLVDVDGAPAEARDRFNARDGK